MNKKKNKFILFDTVYNCEFVFNSIGEIAKRIKSSNSACGRAKNKNTIILNRYYIREYIDED